MAGLGSVSLGTLDLSGVTFSFDESICGMLFDTALYSDPFADHSILESYFSDSQVQLIHSLEEAEDLGLDENFMNGIPYYHIKQFYEYKGEDSDIYLAFASCMSEGNPDFEMIQVMQQSANGKIFQLGIWTEQCIWTSGESSTYEFTGLLGEIEAQAEVLSGIVNQTAADGLPISIILNANTARLDDSDEDVMVDYNSIPYANSLNFPKISVVLGQNGTDEVHSMQGAGNNGAPVGFLGMAMACLAIAPAEMSIGYVDEFDINKNEDILYPELGFGSDIDDPYSLLKNINRVRRNVISLKGYILPTTYKAKEAGVFFCNDQTLSEKDFSTIALNRIAHKCRRIIRSVMFPYVNGNVQIEPSTGALSNIESTKFVNEITERLDAHMLNRLGQDQIGGRYVVIDNSQNLLETDELAVNCYIVPVSSNNTINVEETYILSE